MTAKTAATAPRLPPPLPTVATDKASGSGRGVRCSSSPRVPYLSPTRRRRSIFRGIRFGPRVVGLRINRGTQMEQASWIGRLEDARKEIEEATTDRDAIVIAFTELTRLLLDIKHDIEDKSRTLPTTGD